MKTVNNNVWLPQLWESLFFDSKIDLPNNSERFNVPAVNIVENSDNFVLELAAPGLEKENFSIEVEKDVLKISAEQVSDEVSTNLDENSEENKEADVQVKFRKREFNFSKFTRSFKLPETINSDEIQANYINGVLKITLPKVEEKVLKKMVEIS